jgi:hypothetical protein
MCTAVPLDFGHRQYYNTTTFWKLGRGGGEKAKSSRELENLKKLDNLVVDGRIILKLILNNAF